MTAKALSRLRTLLTSCFLGGLVLVSGTSAGAGPESLPKPTDYVGDFAHVLSRRAVKEIDRVCTELDHSKADVQIAVATIPSLDGVESADYARALANTWGVGRKGRGVLVLLAVNDKKWRIAVGKGLESILPDPTVQDIGDALIPQLRANDFDDAAMLVVHEIAQAVLDAQGGTSTQKRATPPGAGRGSLPYAIFV